MEEGVRVEDTDREMSRNKVRRELGLPRGVDCILI